MVEYLPVVKRAKYRFRIVEPLGLRLWGREVEHVTIRDVRSLSRESAERYLQKRYPHARIEWLGVMRYGRLIPAEQVTKEAS